MINKITYTLLVSIVLLCCGTINAQDLKVIDNKGTLKSINKVTYGADVTSLPTLNVKGDIYIVGNATTAKETYVFDGTNWVKIGSKSHTGEEGSVFFADTDGSPTEDNDHLFWDNSNNRLYVGSKLTGTNKLNVDGTTRTSGLNNSKGTRSLPSYRFTEDSDTGMFRGTLADHLRFTTGGVEALTINNLQNIGIGINAPTHKLDVNGKLKVRTIEEPSALINTDRLAFVDADGVFKKISTDNLGFWKTKGNSGTNAITNFIGTTDNTDLVFKTNNVEGIRLQKSTNRVGIGVIVPKAHLDIKDDLRIGKVGYGNLSEVDILAINKGNKVVRKVESSRFQSKVITKSPPTGMTSRTIATHKAYNGDAATNVDIKETITKITQPTTNNDAATTASIPSAKTIATYKNEAGTPFKVNETITKIEQIGHTQTTPQKATTTNEYGFIKYKDEDDTITQQVARVVSTDANNSIKVGTDGGAYMQTTMIKAAGRVNANGTTLSMFNSSASKNSDWVNRNGTYRVTFNNPITGYYTVNSTIWMDSINADVRIIKVTNIDSTGFNLIITNGYGSRVNDCGFMFTVNKLP